MTEVRRSEDRPNQWALTVSPDEEWIAYAETPVPTSELMLVENFG